MQEEYNETANFTHIHPEGLLLEQEVEEERRYRLSLWWVQNKAKIKKIGLVIFLVFDLLLLIVAGWFFVDAYLLQRASEEAALEQMVESGQGDLNAYTQATAAKDLDFEKPRVFALGEGEYDFYATLINSNTDWWAEYTYQFTHKNGETEVLSGFILPDEEKPLVVLGVQSEEVLTSASLVIDEVEWHRVDHHVTGDYETWFADRDQFVISDAVYAQTIELEEESGFDLGRVTFTVKNNSPFSYYQPRFYVVLVRNTTPVGVNITTLKSIETGSEHDITVNWFGSRPSATSVEIIPEINVFDLDAYKPLEGELADDLRTRVFDR